MILLTAEVVSTELWLYEPQSALPYKAIAIFDIVLLNAVRGYSQQPQAEEAVAALCQMSAAWAKVIRGGTQQSIPSATLVPGDVLVEKGDTIRADARLVRSTALQTAEAAPSPRSPQRRPQ